MSSVTRRLDATQISCSIHDMGQTSNHKRGRNHRGQPGSILATASPEVRKAIARAERTYVEEWRALETWYGAGCGPAMGPRSAIYGEDQH